MQTQAIRLDRERAKELYHQYLTHQHYAKPIDYEIQRVYKLISQGHVIIRALESVRSAGLNEQGLPKMAIVRADAEQCFLHLRSDGSADFSMYEWRRRNATRQHIEFPEGTFPGASSRWYQRAIVPLIPIHLRPKRGIENYHLLWEADWEAVPRDPMLLRRLISKGDLWLVVAAWDLTDVEHAALSARIHVA